MRWLLKDDDAKNTRRSELCPAENQGRNRNQKWQSNNLWLEIEMMVKNFSEVKPRVSPGEIIVVEAN